MGNKITLPWPPKQLSPNARVHWAKKAGIAKRYKQQCFVLAKLENVKAPETDRIHLFVNIYKPDRRVRDQDNIEASLKYLYDGVADALCVNDSRFVIHTNVCEEIINGGIIMITIEGNTDE
jgi:crossover junction endodeoxyribonuclease RusA